jgi:superoxide dismutase, Cu-Zn family
MKIWRDIKTVNMKKKSLGKLFIMAPITTAIIFLVACGSTTSNKNSSDTTTTTGKNAAVADTGSRAMATLSGTKTDTSVNGTATFEKDGNEVKMHLELTIPTKANSSVAVHFHAMSDCGDMGKMAGGHWNPTNENHGKWGAGNFHSGDIGNINLDASGKGMADITSSRWTIGGDTTTNIIGKTIIVHSGVDDYTSQPAGNSGERIACGVIQ